MKKKIIFPVIIFLLLIFIVFSIFLVVNEKKSNTNKNGGNTENPSISSEEFFMGFSDSDFADINPNNTNDTMFPDIGSVNVYYIDSDKYKTKLPYDINQVTMFTALDKNNNEFIYRVETTYFEEDIGEEALIDVINKDISIIKETLSVKNMFVYFSIFSEENGYYTTKEINQEHIDDILCNEINYMTVNIFDDNTWNVEILIRPHQNGSYEIYTTYDRKDIEPIKKVES